MVSHPYWWPGQEQTCSLALVWPRRQQLHAGRAESWGVRVARQDWRCDRAERMKINRYQRE